MPQLTADLLLLLITVVWGSSFVIVKGAIATMTPMYFIAVRFLIAGLVLLVWHIVRAGPKEWRRASREFYAGSLVTGLVLFFSYATQTLGLVTVAAGKAAFLTGLYVVIVPIASRALLREVPDRASVTGVLLATAGLGLLSLKLPFQVAYGDILMFLCAFGFALHILLISRYSGHGDPIFFTALQILVVSAGSFVYAFAFERPLSVPSGAWGPMLFTALFCTSLAFLTQSAVQRYTSATHTALIFSAEPVFGAVFAWYLGGETLLAREMVGAVCILIGMLVSELGGSRAADKARQKRSTDEGSRSAP